MSNSNATRDDGHEPDRPWRLLMVPAHRQEKPLRTLAAVIALCAGALALGACDKTPSSPPAPRVEPARIAPGATAGPVGDTSVPPAESVLPTANATKTDPTLGRSNSTMSAAQESTAMPMPGQNNDHSSALGAAKRASAP